VFCSNCGKELAAESKFCNECGARTTTESAEKNKATQKSVNDEEIRMELKKYEQRTARPFLCLECGYEGLMGMSFEQFSDWRRRRLKSIIAFVIVLIISAVYYIEISPVQGMRFSLWFYVVNFLSGTVAHFYAINTKRFRICPNCQNKLQV